jgi:transposase
VTAANVNDITQLGPLSNAIPPVAGQVGHPTKTPDAVQGDLAYDSEPHRPGLRDLGVEPVLPEKGIDDQSGWGETRWPVERTLAWLHQNRRLRVRSERRPDIHQALPTLACIKICASALLSSAGRVKTLAFRAPHYCIAYAARDWNHPKMSIVDP